MKKRISIPLIVTGSIIAALLLAVLIMGFISIKPFKDFTDYSSVEITTQNGRLANESVQNDKELKGKLDKGLKKTSFSVLRAVFEWNFGYDFKLDKVKDENDKKVPAELTYSEVEQKAVASETQHIITISLKEQKTMTVEGRKIAYDTVKVILTDTNGGIGKITVYPYLADMIYGVGDPEVEDYRIYSVKVKANTTSLYRAVNEIDEVL